MTDYEERRSVPWQEHRAILEYWMELGLSRRNANGLINAGFASIEALKTATDHDLAVIANVGIEGKAIIYRLIDRKPPGVLRTAAERRSTFEGAWRARFGDDRFNRLMDEIGELAGDDLARVNGHAAQALWNAARRRRVER